MIPLWCNEHSSMYSWYPPHKSWYSHKVINILDVLMISLNVLMISLNVLMISLNVLMISLNVLMISLHMNHDTPWRTEHPSMNSRYPLDVFMISGCTEHTLYKVIGQNSVTGWIDCLPRGFMYCHGYVVTVFIILGLEDDAATQDLVSDTESEY